MKQLNYKFILFFSLLVLAACGGGDDDNNDPQTFQMETTLPAVNASVILEITKLNAEIDNIEGTPQWLQAIKGSKDGQHPKIELKAENNEMKESRSCVLKITATSGQRVLLSVTQAGYNPSNTTIYDSHDIPTDQPAYSRQM